MKGFGILLALASCAILLICGPPALASGAQNYSDLHIATIDGIGSVGAGQLDLVQTPDACPAGLQVVPDPGSRSGLSCEVACQLKNILPAARPRNILRQGVRLLTRLPCC